MENLKMTYIIEHLDYVNGMNRLALRIIQQTHKVYTISSNQDKEGKTTVAYNLATALARLQKKVCIVSVDMLSKIDSNTSDTLLTYLTGDVELYQVINKEDDFDFIESNNSDSSATLLSSDRFSSLIDELKSNYDFVLLDSPSLDTHVDTMLIAKRSDALILVIEEGKNSKDKLETILLSLKRNNIVVLGTVLNKINNPRSLSFKSIKRKGSEAY